MANAANVVPIHEPGWDCEVVGDAPQQVPDGEYSARYLGHDTAVAFKTGKVFLRFAIADLGPYCEIKLYRPYRVRTVVGRPGPGGKFSLNRGSDLYKDLARLLDVSRRPDRISLHSLKGRVWRIRTRTVIRDYQQRELPEVLRYSVIDQILFAETG